MVSVFAKSNRRVSFIDRLARLEAILFQAFLDATSFQVRSFTKDEEIINKKEVMKSWKVSRKLKTFKITSPSLFEH